MNVSPLDLRQQRFRTSFRGYDTIEVSAFLVAVADDYEHALRETDRLRQEVTRLETILNEHRQHEGILKNTLVTAQKLADDIKGGAEQDAERIIRDAQSRADLILHKAQSRLEDIQREIDGMRLKRKDVETTLEASIQTLQNTLEYVRDQDMRERDEKVRVHWPKLDRQDERMVG